jgi:predicted ATPase/class 3 adenylate cyclase
MASLPAGTVTFLFTDVEGSTKLLEDLGAERYASVLAEHRRLIREAVAEHGGVEVDTQGDAFFCAFGSARAAVACAQRAQRSLEAIPIRARMGLHTGEALVDGDRYVGLDVHRAARIGGAGHGGQVVLSPATIALLEPGSFPLLDLGEHRLKDLLAPLRLYQLGDGSFPPLKTLHRTSLPVPATPFLGRERELERILALAGDHSIRLLTLTGPGGTGKTRLALQVAAEVAEEFPGGVFWVPLASVRDPALVASAVAQALGVEEEAGDDIPRAIARSIDKRTLLLVDNCEHLLEGVAAAVPPILGSGADLRVIATSREPLSLAGEHVVPVDPLVRADAVALFRARAEEVGALPADDEVVSLLCARLDDLPLAVELAAARSAALPPNVLLERLSRRLDLLRGPRDADARQQTLRATIGWSHDLLSPAEQRLFRRLSIFAGGGTLEAVDAVAEGDLDELASLVAKSLVRMTLGPRGPRYWQLETIRQFAGERLAEEGEAEMVEKRYVAWFARIAADADANLDDEDAAAWLEEVEAELANLRVAFAAAAAGGAEGTAVLGAVLGQLLTVRGRYTEAHEVLARAAEHRSGPWPGSKLRRCLGRVLVVRNEFDAAASAYAEAERLLGPPPAEGGKEHWRRWLDVKLAQASLHYWRADTAALAHAAAAIGADVDRFGTRRQRAEFLHVLLQDSFRRERYVLSAETEELGRKAFAAMTAAGSWDSHFQLGFTLLWRGKLGEADEELRLGREQARAAGDVLVETRCLVYRAVARRKLGDVEAVRALDYEIAALEDPGGYVGLIAGNRAWLAWRDRDLDAAELRATDALRDWERSSRAGPTVFQWSARFPLVAVGVMRDQLEVSSEHARVMLHESQQPLPADVQNALRDALQAAETAAFAQAIEVATPYGYT